MITMKIETYEIEPETLSDGSVETDEEAIKLIESMGLEGQQSLVKPAANGKAAVRTPYQQMTNEEVAVFKACFPVHDGVEKYSAGLIPTRCLQVAALGKDLFGHVEVWHERDVRDPDPLLVGVNPGETSYGAKKYFLLARWGEELIELGAWFQGLIPKAREKIRAALEAKVKKHQGQVDAFKAAIELNVENTMKGESLANNLY